MNNPAEAILCQEHRVYVYPFWSQKNKEWYAVCNAEVSNLKNGQTGKGHFIKINDDLEFDRGYQNQANDYERK